MLMIKYWVYISPSLGDICEFYYHNQILPAEIFVSTNCSMNISLKCIELFSLVCCFVRFGAIFLTVAPYKAPKGTRSLCWGGGGGEGSDSLLVCSLCVWEDETHLPFQRQPHFFQACVSSSERLPRRLKNDWGFVACTLTRALRMQWAMGWLPNLVRETCLKQLSPR